MKSICSGTGWMRAMHNTTECAPARSSHTHSANHVHASKLNDEWFVCWWRTVYVNWSSRWSQRNYYKYPSITLGDTNALFFPPHLLFHRHQIRFWKKKSIEWHLIFNTISLFFATEHTASGFVEKKRHFHHLYTNYDRFGIWKFNDIMIFDMKI